MPELHVTWLTAGIVASVLGGLGALVTAHVRDRRLGPAIREVGVVIGLFALWMAVGHLVGHHPAGGYARGREIWHAEQWLHVADEAALQAPLLHHPALLRAANYYYAYAHWLSVDVVLAWLWWRHRVDYVATRTALVLFTGGCLLLHLVSTAPPRLLTDTHVVDTGALLGQSVYNDSPGVADHLSAMPSIHMGWAVLFALAVWRVAPPAGRLAAAGHAVLTSYVVVVTGNHFWLDGAAAAMLVGLAWAVAPVLTWQDAWRGAAVGVGIGPDPAGRGGQAPRPRRGHAPAAGDSAP